MELTMKELKKQEYDASMEHLWKNSGLKDFLRAAFNQGWAAGIKAQAEIDGEKYQSGLNKAWLIMGKVFSLTESERLDIWGVTSAEEVLVENTPNNIASAIQSYEDKQKVAWKKNNPDGTFDIFECSVCRHRASQMTPYCPNCGTKLGG